MPTYANTKTVKTELQYKTSKNLVTLNSLNTGPGASDATEVDFSVGKTCRLLRGCFHEPSKGEELLFVFGVYKYH